MARSKAHASGPLDKHASALRLSPLMGKGSGTVNANAKQRLSMKAQRKGNRGAKKPSYTRKPQHVPPRTPGWAAWWATCEASAEVQTATALSSFTSGISYYDIFCGILQTGLTGLTSPPLCAHRRYEELGEFLRTHGDSYPGKRARDPGQQPPRLHAALVGRPIPAY